MLTDSLCGLFAALGVSGSCGLLKVVHL